MAGMSFTDDGRLVRRDGNTFYVHSATADTTVRGTNTIHSATAFTIAGLPTSSLWSGMTAAGNNTYYALASDGIYNVDLFGQTASLLPNTSASTRGAYGIGYHPSGNIIYNQFTSSDDGNVMAYNLATGTLTSIYDTTDFNDDLVIAPTGEIFTATLGDGGHIRDITILDWNGSGSATHIQTINAPNGADGLALSLDGSLFSNDKFGSASLTQYVFAGGDYSAAVTRNDIAFGDAISGDLGTVGPDGLFYISRQNQVYDDLSTELGWSIVSVGPGFVSPPIPTPIPPAIWLFGTGLLGLIGFGRRK
jgi:hypothetical protein